MRIRRTISISVILLLFIFASGCSLILSRDYLVITPHLEDRDDKGSGDELRAETYDDLKNSILYLIEEGIGEGVIRLYNYDGDPESDSERAIKDTMNYDPLGAYAVEYMSYRCVRILAYHEVTVSITYQKTPEQIKAIEVAESITAFKELLSSAYTDYRSILAVLVPWYYEDQYDVGEILESIYFNDPLSHAVPPSYTLKIYPDTESGSQVTGLQRYDWQRLLEITFEFPRPAGELQRMTEVLRARVDALLPKSGIPAGAEGARQLGKIVSDSAEPVPDPDTENVEKDLSYTAYGALVSGSATSEGYALAFKALCKRSGIECHVISGRYNGYLHCWNLVSIDGDWYHVDSFQNDVTGSLDFLLKTDDQMAVLGYKWNNASYPASAGTEISLFIEEASAIETPVE